MLKTNGTLVYSTCTVTAQENEGMVAWALNKFKCLHLEQIESPYGDPGWNHPQLANGDRIKVKRFGPSSNLDSVGFFIARFRKNTVL